jgi:hypothetical protein
LSTYIRDSTGISRVAQTVGVEPPDVETYPHRP